MTGSIRSIGVAFPEEVRTNDWWTPRYPDLVANAREATLSKVWTDFNIETASIYDRAIAKYLSDPFRGTVERRVMGPNDTALDLEARAARSALRAGGFAPEDIDLVLVSALRPDTHVVGDAAYLVKELGFRAPAIDFETACSSALFGYHLASDLLKAGRYRRILVVVCCTYTRDADLADSFSWFLGDGAAAFVVEPGTPLSDGRLSGLLGAHTIPTIETCGAFAYDLRITEGGPAMRLIANQKIAGKSIRDGSEIFLRRCVDGALGEAGVQLADIDFLVVNTPTAWYAEFCANALGFGADRTIDNYPRYANCGPVLWPNNLLTAVKQGRVRPGDMVLGYAVGSVSTATAAVFRTGDIAFEEDPSTSAFVTSPR